MLDDIIELYTTLTGKQISDNLLPQYEAWARRALAELEGKLGWSLAGVSNVNVLGVSPRGCDCDIDKSKLLDAPEKKGEYRFFSFDTKKPNLHVDPFKKVHAVYFCRVVDTEDESSQNIDTIILKEIKPTSPKYMTPKFGKYIQACQEMTICQAACEKSCTQCSAILVDADWATLDDLEDVLGPLLCDYIDWMAEGGMESRGLQSESVDGHSVSYRGWNYTQPYLNPINSEVIQFWAGPYGMLSRKRVW